MASRSWSLLRVVIAIRQGSQSPVSVTGTIIMRQDLVVLSVKNNAGLLTLWLIVPRQSTKHQRRRIMYRVLDTVTLELTDKELRMVSDALLSAAYYASMAT